MGHVSCELGIGPQPTHLRFPVAKERKSNRDETERTKKEIL